MNRMGASASSLPDSATPRASAPQPRTAGWEPDAPVGDTLLRRFVFNLASCWEAPVAAAGGSVTRTDAYAAADLGRPAGYWNGATLLQPLPPGHAHSDAVLHDIEAALAVDEPDRSGAVMLWSAWPTPDLRRRGWTLEGHPPFLLRPPGPLPETSSTSGVEIARVTDGRGLRDFERVVVDGYPFLDLQPYRPGSLFDERLLGDPRIHLQVGYDTTLQRRPVTVGGLCIEAGLAGFLIGVTLPEARGKGCWAAMVRSRLLAASDLPAAGLFSDKSRPRAERLFGFLPVSRFTLWSRSRPGATT